jgi:hypothetical protein
VIHVRNLLVLILGLVFLGACDNSGPVVPVPPPPIGDLTFDLKGTSQNQVVFNGRPNSSFRGATFFHFNQRTAKGLITKASDLDGSYVTDPLEAQDRDRLDYWVSLSAGDAQSEVICIVLDFTEKKISSCGL